MKIILCLLVLLSSMGGAYAACAPGDNFTLINATHIEACNCTQEYVQYAVDNATDGMTVMIPAGNCTWSSQLVIDKGIHLNGNGIDQTVITGNLGLTTTSTTYIIMVAPAEPEVNRAVRISGFTFDMNQYSKGIILATGVIPQTMIRVDHNKFMNISSLTYPDMQVDGAMYGTIDNNIFDGPKSHISFYGKQGDSWDTPPEGNDTPYAYGTSNNMYVENNTFASISTYHAGGYGGRYIARYNEYNYTNTAGLYPAFDAHGNQKSGVYAMMGVECYGNNITAPNIASGNGIRAFAHRGGKLVFFYNKASGNTLTTNPTVQAFEEYADEISPDTNIQPQHVSDSYYWANWKGTNAFGLEVTNWIPGDNCGAAVYPVGNCSSYLISENTDFYMYNSTFDGTVGVGCGNISSIPATCAIGAGYWATEQNCTNLENTTGNSPTAPINGILYKCTAADTWSAYYVPFDYPHPLISGLPGVNLNAPYNLKTTTETTIQFNISVIDSGELKNITLYGNWNGGWHANETINIDETYNETTFTKILPDGDYIWNCLVYDEDNNFDWGNMNFSFIVNTGGFSPSHTKSYYNTSTQIQNTVNNTGHIIWDRTITSNDAESNFNIEVTIT